MLPKFLRWPVLAALLPGAALAQSAPRLYVGAGAVLRRFAPFEAPASTSVGPAATAGWQFSPRWALETGAQLTWHSTTSTYRPIDPNDPNGSFPTSNTHSAAWVVPLLARYSFSRPPARLRVDALGGVSWLHNSSRVDYTSLQVPPLLSQGTSNEVGVVLGPQVRYSFGPALEAKLNLPFNVNMGSGYGSFGDRLFLTPQLGVQYAFTR